MNFFAILVAGLAGMAIGFFWYGPLFGKIWLRLSNITPDKIAEAQKKGMGKTYALSMLGMLVTAWILNILITEFATSTGGALRIAGLVWLGILVPTMANSVLWEGRSAKLFMLNAAERLVTLLVMSGILAAWM